MLLHCLPNFRKLGDVSVNWCHPVGAARRQFLSSVLVSEYFSLTCGMDSSRFLKIYLFLFTALWDMLVNTGNRSPGAIKDGSPQLLPSAVTCPITDRSVV